MSKWYLKNYAECARKNLRLQPLLVPNATAENIEFEEQNIREKDR
jgi:hypothetical protein